MAIHRTFQTPCQSCAGLTRELNIALYSHIQVNKAVYGYVQDLPDTFLVLRRIDQGAIYSYIQPYKSKYTCIWLYTGPS